MHCKEVLMRSIIKLFLAAVFMFVFILLIVLGYDKYRNKQLRRLVDAWKEKYHPFPPHEEA